MLRIFRRPSEGDLANTYLQLRAIDETLWKQYRKAKESKQLEREIELCRLIVENGLRQIEAMTEIVRRFSPQVARGLKSQFKSFKKLSMRQFTELSTNYDRFPRETKNKMIRDFIELKLDSLKIQEKFANIAFLAITDTLQTVKRPFLRQKNIILLQLLNKVDSKYAKLYNASWASLESNNPDRSRQCATTLRELLSGIINEKGKGRDRAAKVTYVLREQEDPKFIKAFVAFVEAVSKFLGKAVHKEMDPKSIAFATNMVEDILLFILKGVK